MPHCGVSRASQVLPEAGSTYSEARRRQSTKQPLPHGKCLLVPHLSLRAVLESAPVNWVPQALHRMKLPALGLKMHVTQRDGAAREIAILLLLPWPRAFMCDSLSAI